MERLLRFPSHQVILLDEKQEYEVRRDDSMKLMNLPIWQVQSLAADMETATKCRRSSLKRSLKAFTTFASAVRLDQRIALLRHIEALRLYAADHKGLLPAKLSDFSLPLPDDPSTGKPFRYDVIGNTAHLRGSPAFGEEKNPAANIHYEVTLQN